MNKAFRTIVAATVSLVLSVALCSCNVEQSPSEQTPVSSATSSDTINSAPLSSIDAVEAFGYVDVSHSQRFILNRGNAYDMNSGLIVWFPAGWDLNGFSNTASYQGIYLSANDALKEEGTFASLSEWAEAAWDIESVAYQNHLRYSVPVGTTGSGLMYIWDESDIASNRLYQGAENNWKALVFFEDSEYYYVVEWYLRDSNEKDLYDTIPMFISLLQYIETGEGRTLL